MLLSSRPVPVRLPSLPVALAVATPLLNNLLGPLPTEVVHLFKPGLLGMVAVHPLQPAAMATVAELQLRLAPQVDLQAASEVVQVAHPMVEALPLPTVLVPLLQLNLPSLQVTPLQLRRMPCQLFP